MVKGFQMTSQIAEFAGVFLLLIGFGAIVAAASLVSTALAILSAGALLVFAGTVVVYVANAKGSGK
jgi:hypothetical protein